MKATGIVRRIDDLGRVVIPKEIRRTIRIREGDPLEIFTANNGEIVLKKYSPIGELSNFSGDCASVVHKITGKQTVICDRDHVIIATGSNKKELMGRRVSSSLEEFMVTRKNYTLSSKSEKLYPIESSEHEALCMATIIASGDVYGAVMIITDNIDEKCSESDKIAVELAAGFLGKQLEE